MTVESPGSRVTFSDTETRLKAAETVTFCLAAEVFFKGMLIETYALDVSGRCRSVTICGCEILTSPTVRSLTSSSIPVALSRVAGIQSHPDEQIYVGEALVMILELTHPVPSSLLSPGTPTSSIGESLTATTFSPSTLM